MKTIPLSKVILASAAVSVLFLLVFVGGIWFVAKGFKKPVVTMAPPPPKPTEVAKKGQGIDYKDLHELAAKLDQWSQDLDKKQKQSNEEEQSLNQREQILKAEQEKITLLQKGLEDKILRIEKHEGQSYIDMASIYADMKPEQAAVLMRKLTDERAARMLTCMKPTKTAKLLETWVASFPEDSERVAKISDQMRIVVTDDDSSVATSANTTTASTGTPTP